VQVLKFVGQLVSYGERIQAIYGSRSNGNMTGQHALIVAQTAICG
jgi:hypothetical protein